MTFPELGLEKKDAKGFMESLEKMTGRISMPRKSGRKKKK